MGNFASQMGKAVKKVLPRAFPPGRNPAALSQAAQEYDFDAIQSGVEGRVLNAAPMGAITLQSTDSSVDINGGSGPVTSTSFDLTLPAPGGMNWRFGVTLHADSTGLHWSNQPSAETEFNGDTRHRTAVDVSDMATGRIAARILDQGASGSYITLEWRDYGSSGAWARLLGDYGLSLQNVGTFHTGWLALDPDAIAAGEIEIRILGGSGNDALDPEFGVIVAWFRTSATTNFSGDEQALPAPA